MKRKPLAGVAMENDKRARHGRAGLHDPFHAAQAAVLAPAGNNESSFEISLKKLFSFFFRSQTDGPQHIGLFSIIARGL